MAQVVNERLGITYDPGISASSFSGISTIYIDGQMLSSSTNYIMSFPSSGSSASFIPISGCGPDIYKYANEYKKKESKDYDGEVSD